MTDTTRTINGASGGLQGRHVLFMLLAFFGTIFAVNGYFLYSALSTHTGVVSVEPYRKGLAYNQRIAADERQTALGWKDDTGATMAGKVTVSLIDSTGKAIGGLVVKATLGRPSTIRHDHVIALKENTESRYVAEVGALEEGNWVVAVEAFSPGNDEPVYRARRRLWLKH